MPLLAYSPTRLLTPVIKLVVGLGNPGKEYAHTRHNIGYRVIDLLEEVNLEGVQLFRPASFMNQAGGPVAEVLRRKGLKADEMLVVCDDFSIPLGALRLRLKGSSGGHNGLNSILDALGTRDVSRLRVGIGPVPPDQDPADFVLASFSSREKKPLENILPVAAEAVQRAVHEGIESAMNRYNKTLLES